MPDPLGNPLDPLPDPQAPARVAQTLQDAADGQWRSALDAARTEGYQAPEYGDILPGMSYSLVGTGLPSISFRVTDDGQRFDQVVVLP